MKAIVCTQYGPPEALQLKDVPTPSPGPNEVLVKIVAASITFSNLMLTTGEPFVGRLAGLGLFKPYQPIAGSDIAGRVEAVGSAVTRFQPGDEVYGDLSRCGRGGFAEYVCAPENALGLKPTNMTFEEASTVPEAALVALQALRDHGRIKAGQKVLINGASGGIGTFAVQLAKSYGAEVTGVCSAKNLELVRSLGADYVIDYTQEDFTQNGRQYDLIVATAGYRSIFDYKRALSPTGIYVSTGGTMTQTFQSMLLGPFLSMFGSQKLGVMLVKVNQDLALMKELIEAGKVKAVIDKRYKLADTAQALSYYRQGHTRGKVVIVM